MIIDVETICLSIRFVQSKLRHRQLGGAYKAAERFAQQHPRAQSRSANRRLVQFGKVWPIRLFSAVELVQISEERKRHYALVFGYERLRVLVRPHAPQ